MLLVPCRDKTPQWGQNCFFAENATLIGDVQMGDDCSVCFQAVGRGDVNFIRMGHKVNIQDGAILHGTEAPTALLNNAALYHRLLGSPRVSVDQMMDWITAWITQGGASLGKPTHFENREGKF